MYIHHFQNKSQSMNISITYKYTISIRVSVTVRVRTFVGILGTCVGQYACEDIPMRVISHLLILNNILEDSLVTNDLFILGGIIFQFISFNSLKNAGPEFWTDFCLSLKNHN